MKFLGKCAGVVLKDRGQNDKHQCFEILIEDDENWIPKMSMSSFWIDDLIKQLQLAKNALETHYEKDPSGFGYIKK